MRQIAYQVKDLCYQGRVIAQQCVDTLLPLREEARQHNQLSAVISKQLSQVRKKGLVRGLNSNNLPVWKSNRAIKIQLGSEVRQLMAEFMDFGSHTLEKARRFYFPTKTRQSLSDKETSSL